MTPEEKGKLTDLQTVTLGHRLYLSVDDLLIGLLKAPGDYIKKQELIESLEKLKR